MLDAEHEAANDWVEEQVDKEHERVLGLMDLFELEFEVFVPAEENPRVQAAIEEWFASGPDALTEATYEAWRSSSAVDLERWGPSGMPADIETLALEFGGWEEALAVALGREEARQRDAIRAVRWFDDAQNHC